MVSHRYGMVLRCCAIEEIVQALRGAAVRSEGIHIVGQFDSAHSAAGIALDSAVLYAPCRRSGTSCFWWLGR